VTEVLVNLLPKQLDFMRSTAREVGYSGAFGAGKTRALCYRAVARASLPGSREALVRKHLTALKATTLKTLLEPEGDLPPVLPAGSYEHNKADKTIRIRGGGEIVYFALDDPDKVGSFNLSGCGIDEVVELAERDYTQLRGRNRLKIKGLPNQIYWACNPGPPTHFIAQRFGLALGAKPADGCVAIQTSSRENTFLPADYLADLETFSGVAHKRYVLGLWVGSEGLVYDSWDRSSHVRQREPSEFRRWIIGVDDGYTNPMAAVLLGLDGDDRIHVLEERYRSGLAMSEKVRHVAELAARVTKLGGRLEMIIADPAAAQLIREIRDAGLPVTDKVDKSIFDGIQQVQQRLRVAGDGLPRLTVDPSCSNVQREFETYEWRERSGVRTDEPVKAHDHALDALRYATRYVDGKRGGLRL
jgi:PBSX family phage terminase large subunit